jgi:hypothetical protein
MRIIAPPAHGAGVSGGTLQARFFEHADVVVLEACRWNALPQAQDCEMVTFDHRSRTFI